MQQTVRTSSKANVRNQNYVHSTYTQQWLTHARGLGFLGSSASKLYIPVLIDTGNWSEDAPCHLCHYPMQFSFERTSPCRTYFFELINVRSYARTDFSNYNVLMAKTSHAQSRKRCTAATPLWLAVSVIEVPVVSANLLYTWMHALARYAQIFKIVQTLNTVTGIILIL